jgi:hypothetical protein
VNSQTIRCHFHGFPSHGNAQLGPTIGCIVEHGQQRRFILALVSAILTTGSDVDTLIPMTTEESGTAMPPSYASGFASAVAELRSSSNVHFSSTSLDDSGTVTGSDSKGGLQITWRTFSSGATSSIRGSLVSDSSLRSAAAGRGSVLATEFIIDPPSMTLISSKPITPGIIARHSGTPTETT